MAISDMGPMADKMFADTIEWDWTGPQKGKGTKEALVKEFADTWGSMVSSFTPGDVIITVDPDASLVAVSLYITININLHGKVANCYPTITGNVQLKLDGENRITYWQFLWDNQDPKLVSCVGKAQAFLSKEL